MRFVIERAKPALIVGLRDGFGNQTEVMHIMSWRDAKKLRKQLGFVLKCEPKTAATARAKGGEA